MLRTVFLACLLVVCLQIALADDAFVIRYFVSSSEKDKVNSNSQPIKYLIKKNVNAKDNTPVFYGVGGRDVVETIRDRYQLFDKTRNEFDNSAVVYVEQRFFGSSKAANISQLSDLASLKLDNVIADHVGLITQLSTDLKTNKFLVFGAGYGGVIAGYIANRFQANNDLSSKFNVMAWSSSPPLKYLRQNADLLDLTVADISKQFTTLLTTYGGCSADPAQGDIKKFSGLFSSIRKLKITDNAAIINALNLNPVPVDDKADGARAGDYVASDLLELIVFIRKRMIELTFDDVSFSPDGKTPSRKITALCTAMKALPDALPDPITSDQINSVLAVFGATATNKLQWKITDDGSGKWNSDLAAAAYQDCTEYNLNYCTPQSDATNPFSASGWDIRSECTPDNIATLKQTECAGLFRQTTQWTLGDLPAGYPRSLTKNTVTTMSGQSIFASSRSKFASDDKNYVHYWDVEEPEYWEFGITRVCDGPKIKDTRFLILRGFGCFSGIIDNSVCGDKVFDDGKQQPDPDVTKPPVDCSPDTTISGAFPFGKNVTIIYQNPDDDDNHDTDEAGFNSPLIILTSYLLVLFGTYLL